jgi:hypothetical protein
MHEAASTSGEPAIGLDTKRHPYPSWPFVHPRLLLRVKNLTCLLCRATSAHYYIECYRRE